MAKASKRGVETAKSGWNIYLNAVGKSCQQKWPRCRKEIKRAATGRKIFAAEEMRAARRRTDGRVQLAFLGLQVGKQP